MGQIKVFLDSDVLISAFLSKTGASFAILNDPKIPKIISRSIEIEVLEVGKRLNLQIKNLNVFENLEIITIKLEKTRLSERYFQYVQDQEDSHVIAAAFRAKVKFLLTHNVKHFYSTKIKNDLDINVIIPGQFLQYLRSQKTPGVYSRD